ncbi:MAG: hypothetical protein WBE34_18385 [Candidatus Nitrosopolaris sp.]
MPSLQDGKELHRSIHKEAAVFNHVSIFLDSSSTSIGAVNILLPRVEIAIPPWYLCQGNVLLFLLLALEYFKKHNLLRFNST